MRQGKWVLAALVVVAGLFIFTNAQETVSNEPPLVEVPPDVTAPGICAGIAMDPEEEDVTVRAYVDGVEIEGSPDIEMEGPANEFAFPVTEEMRGKIIKIVAEDESGATRTKYVSVF
jgi:hypothetical protein